MHTSPESLNLELKQSILTVINKENIAPAPTCEAELNRESKAIRVF